MDYKAVTPKDIDRLIEICGKDNVLSGSDIHEDYSRDELVGIRQYPDVVVLPLNTQQVSEVMKYAYEQNIAVTPRGQGTGLVGASIAIYKGIMLSTERMNKILELDDANLTLTVEPGVLLMEISEYVEKNDLFYPPDPGEKSASIGGNISTNAGGMRAVKYGVTRDYVRELEIVLSNGEILTVGGKIVKDSSGYSLKDLIVGSEGTLAIVTKAVLKLLPLPEVAISLLVPYPDIDTAISAVPIIIKSKAIPTAIEYMERNVILSAENYLGKKFPDNSADAYLLLTFDGNSVNEVEAIYEEVAHVCLDSGALDVFISDTDERNESIWSARGAFLEAIKASTSEMDECDVVVPRNHVADFIKYSKFVEKELDVRIASFGHAGDGNLHIYVLKDDLPDNIFAKKLSTAFDMLYKKGDELGGHVSGEHGIGFAKKPYLEKMAGPVYMGLLKGIKKTFDPKLILNPGKVC